MFFHEFHFFFCQVQHKLDKEHYAIKKIKVTKKKTCSLQVSICFMITHVFSDTFNPDYYSMMMKRGRGEREDAD